MHEKEKWRHQLGTEEGWTCIPGEKEFLTLRTLGGTPDVLKEQVRAYWGLVGEYVEGCVGRVGGSLGLELGDGEGEKEGLRRYVGRCAMIREGEEEKSASMLRLFRYEVDSGKEEMKVVAEPHSDLGLLSFVVGSTPGLEVWDGRTFCDVERRMEGPGATLLVGRQLEALTNGRFVAGPHRVVSYGMDGGKGRDRRKSSATTGLRDSVPRYRYSIVFVLRADEDVIVDTDALTTDITGVFKYPIQGITAGEWYKQILRSYFNVNAGKEERDKQKRRIQERKRREGGFKSG